MGIPRSTLLVAGWLLVVAAVPVTSGPGPLEGEELTPRALERVRPGTPAPDFRLTGHGGGVYQLSEQQGTFVVLVFYRGHWCPYCVSQLEQIDTLMRRPALSSVQLWAISVDEGPDSMTFAERTGLEVMVLLEDRDHRVIDRYGLLDYEVPFTVPVPATYVIDREGIVRWRLVEKDFRLRASPEDITCALEALASAREPGECRVRSFEQGSTKPAK